MDNLSGTEIKRLLAAGAPWRRGFRRGLQGQQSGAGFGNYVMIRHSNCYFVRQNNGVPVSQLDYVYSIYRLDSTGENNFAEPK